LIFEHLDQDLHNYLAAAGKMGLDILTTCSFLYQLLQGLACCHRAKIMHRDLKPQNLLLNLAGELKLADFGLARSCAIPIKAQTHEVVTLWYRPPDVMLGSNTYDCKVDMWGVGCIFAEMLTGTPLFSGNTVTEQLTRIFKLLGGPDRRGCAWDPSLHPLWASIAPELPSQVLTAPPCLRGFFAGLPDDGVDLLEGLLQCDPRKRLSADAALKHPFFHRLKTRELILHEAEEMQRVARIQAHFDRASQEAEERRREARREKEEHLRRNMWTGTSERLVMEPLPHGFLYDQDDYQFSGLNTAERSTRAYYKERVAILRQQLQRKDLLQVHLD
jgi:cyclin-dependent kinase